MLSGQIPLSTNHQKETPYSRPIYQQAIKLVLNKKSTDEISVAELEITHKKLCDALKKEYKIPLSPAIFDGFFKFIANYCSRIREDLSRQFFFRRMGIEDALVTNFKSQGVGIVQAEIQEALGVATGDDEEETKPNNKAQLYERFLANEPTIDSIERADACMKGFQLFWQIKEANHTENFEVIYDDYKTYCSIKEALVYITAKREDLLQPTDFLQLRPRIEEFVQEVLETKGTIIAATTEYKLYVQQYEDLHDSHRPRIPGSSSADHELATFYRNEIIPFIKLIPANKCNIGLKGLRLNTQRLSDIVKCIIKERSKPTWHNIQAHKDFLQYAFTHFPDIASATPLIAAEIEKIKIKFDATKTIQQEYKEYKQVPIDANLRTFFDLATQTGEVPIQAERLHREATELYAFTNLWEEKKVEPKEFFAQETVKLTACYQEYKLILAFIQIDNPHLAAKPRFFCTNSNAAALVQNYKDFSTYLRVNHSTVYRQQSFNKALLFKNPGLDTLYKDYKETIRTAKSSTQQTSDYPLATENNDAETAAMPMKAESISTGPRDSDSATSTTNTSTAQSPIISIVLSSPNTAAEPTTSSDTHHLHTTSSTTTPTNNSASADIAIPATAAICMSYQTDPISSTTSAAEPTLSTTDSRSSTIDEEDQKRKALGDTSITSDSSSDEDDAKNTNFDSHAESQDDSANVSRDNSLKIQEEPPIDLNLGIIGTLPPYGNLNVIQRKVSSQEQPLSPPPVVKIDQKIASSQRPWWKRPLVWLAITAIVLALAALPITLAALKLWTALKIVSIVYASVVGLGLLVTSLSALWCRNGQKVAPAPGTVNAVPTIETNFQPSLNSQPQVSPQSNNFVRPPAAENALVAGSFGVQSNKLTPPTTPDSTAQLYGNNTPNTPTINMEL